MCSGRGERGSERQKAGVCAQQNVLIMLKLCTTIYVLNVRSLFAQCERRGEEGAESRQGTSYDRLRGKDKQGYAGHMNVKQKVFLLFSFRCRVRKRQQQSAFSLSLSLRMCVCMRMGVAVFISPVQVDNGCGNSLT